MHVNRPDNYTGPDTPAPKLDPNLLLQICTGSYAEKEYEEVVRVGRKLLETYKEPEPENDASKPTVSSLKDGRSDRGSEARRREDGVRHREVRADAQHPAGAGGGGDPHVLRALRRTEEDLYAQGQELPLPRRRRRGVGLRPAVQNRYRDSLNYEIAMEGLQDLPIYNDIVIKVEKPDPKWPGFPQRVNTISSRGGARPKRRSLACAPAE